MSNVRVRFAPSPTGMLHIGSARTALFNWLYARHTGGTFILRIEDTDAARNTPQAVAAIFAGLQWLGIDWDEGPMADGTTRGDKGPYFQSQRRAIYDSYVQKLLSSGKAYEFEGAIKFRTPKEIITVPDVICGDVQFDRTQEADLVIARKDGSPVFHLTNVVDDLEMGITHVIRGEDHLSNTSKHIALFRALGAEPPKYAHIPLILNRDGSKMSKRNEGAAVAEYPARGYLPEAVMNYLCLLGWSPKDNREIITMQEVIEKFDLPQVNRANARFDMDKLFWINGMYFSEMSLEDTVPLAEKILKEAKVLPADFDVNGEDRNYFRAALAIVKEKIKLAGELPEWMSFFFTDEFSYEEKAVAKVFTPEGLKLLKQLRDDLTEAPFDVVNLELRVKSLAAALGLKSGAFVHPVRLAVSGRSVGPSLYHMLEVMGRDRVLRRIDKALERFSKAQAAAV
ncbi:glutamate--tRNA ligase [Verrucomicrobia bacterium LW23]|nr:glutamate--tRNA ligase [Verrucomicrobia bacterium LW23]